MEVMQRHCEGNDSATGKTTVFTNFCATGAATRYKSRPALLELDTLLKIDGHRSLYDGYKLSCIIQILALFSSNRVYI